MAAPIWLEIIEKERKERTGRLDLGKCGLERLPEEITEMKWLQILILGNRESSTKNNFEKNRIDIKDISYLVNRLEQLTELSLNDLGLIFIPAFTHLKNLTVLDLSFNNISRIEGLQNLTYLRQLDLSNNNITQIIGLQTLNYLQQLDLSNNKIETTDGLPILKNLSTLNLSYNQLKKIEWLINVKNLEDLNLSYNQISIIDGLKHNSNIRKLYLNNNVITEIHGLNGLRKLERLDLFSNQITTIEGLDDLINLHSCYLYSNQITTIEGLDNLTALRVIDLYDNEISKIERLGQLTALSELSLSYNRIEKIEGLENLNSLIKLNLSRNQITKIENLQTLPILNELNLYNNKIKIIDSLEVFPSSLNALYLYENPIQNINLTTFGLTIDYNCISDLKTFFAEQLEINVPEIKLILTGNSDVGKTAFRIFLKTNKYNDVRISTHGLVVEQFQLSDSIKKEYKFEEEIQIYIWDFGGQEYFHNTHQLFFNQHAVYIFLWEKDTNKNEPILTEVEKDTSGKIVTRVLEHFDVNYWLSNIRHFAPDAVIIAVQNKVDKYERKNEPLDWLSHDTIKQYNCGKQYHISISKSAEKDLNYWYDFEKLKHVIFTELHKFVSANKEGNIYNRVRKEIETRKVQHYWKAEDYINFIETLKANSLNEKAKSIDNRLVIEHFCRQGKVLYPSEQKLEKGKVIFTDPQWLSEKIYKILNDAVLQRNGFFDEKDLAKLIETNAIDSKDILYQIIELMKQYSIVFYNKNKNQYVAPQYLPEVPTVHYSQVKKLLAAPQLIIKTRDFLPKSVINNIIAKYAVKNDSASFYKYGVKTEIDKNILLIEADYPNRKIYVYTDANEPVFIRDVFEETLAELNIRLKPVEQNIDAQSEKKETLALKEINITIPEKTVIYISTDDKIFVNWADLWNEHRNTNSNKDYCTAEDGNMVLRKLFALYYLPYTQVISLRRNEQLKSYKLFISYSSKNTEFMRRFVTHLEPLKRNGSVALWHDRMIEPGTKWDDTIKEELKNADLVIFLLSPDFIATNYIFEYEIPQAIMQFENEKSKLFFVELQPCSWHRTVLARFQQTTDTGADNKAVITISNPMNDEEWKKVVDQLEEKIRR